MWEHSGHIGPCRFAKDGKADPPWRKLSQAFWSIEPNGKVVIFVHGWTGDSLGTWTNHLNLWPSELSGCDLVFYGYNSTASQADENAGFFREFLRDFLADPQYMIQKSLSFLTGVLPAWQRNREFHYRRIVIVAHSLGAIVARRALLDLENKRADWLEYARLILFAPAHNGSPWAQAANSSLFTISSIMKALASGVLLGAIPSIHSLVPNCALLKDLREDTEKAINSKDTKEPLIASRTQFPEIERVVYSGPFPGDPPREAPAVGKNHQTVCKPTSVEDLGPVKLIQEILE